MFDRSCYINIQSVVGQLVNKKWRLIFFIHEHMTQNVRYFDVNYKPFCGGKSSYISKQQC